MRSSHDSSRSTHFYLELCSHGISHWSRYYVKRLDELDLLCEAAEKECKRLKKACEELLKKEEPVNKTQRVFLAKAKEKICPECGENNLSSTTCFGGQNGKNVMTTSCRCKNGHSWSVCEDLVIKPDPGLQRMLRDALRPDLCSLCHLLLCDDQALWGDVAHLKCILQQRKKVAESLAKLEEDS